MNTGMRRGEILGLEWNRHVDLRHDFILLDQTKNGGRREIPINQTLRSTLQGLVRHIKSPHVFTDLEGKRFKEVKKSFRTACKRAVIERCPKCSYEGQKTDLETPGNCILCGTRLERRCIADFSFHDLRHTAASHWILAGVDIVTIKEILGHKTMTMAPVRAPCAVPQEKGC
ncbi:MAG: site-specific integrase [Deltaproteobacteria bacterium]|nr:site-specific integrase [Deltaproteobacteria bacterium]